MTYPLTRIKEEELKIHRIDAEKELNFWAKDNSDEQPFILFREFKDKSEAINDLPIQ